MNAACLSRLYQGVLLCSFKQLNQALVWGNGRVLAILAESVFFSHVEPFTGIACIHGLCLFGQK
jgi:hypothetical protein